MNENLYKKDNWINPNMSYLFNAVITEYDMREAGFSLIKEYQLLSQEEILELSKYSKDERHVRIGKLQKKYPDLSKKLSDAFAEARKTFFDLNGLEQDKILSIKKDAIFTLKKCETQEIGAHVVFRPKHEYTSYIHLDKTLEFYYHPTECSVKGLGKKGVAKHKDYMSDIINRFCMKMEQDSSRHALEYMTRFVNYYKKRELDVEYYRTYNQRSEFILIDEPEVFYDKISQDDIDRLDITYNYFNVILKLMKIPL